MEILQRLIKETVESMKLQVPDSEKETYIKLMIQIFDQGVMPKEALGLSDEMVEYMYSYGYRLYNNGNYEHAKNVFSALAIFAPTESRFSLALAASYHRLKDYPNAIQVYARYGRQEMNNPLPFYYLYDCYYQLGNIGDAEICLMEVINRCAENPLYAKIKERCTLMLENLRDEFKQLEAQGLIEIDETAATEAGYDIKNLKKM